MLTDACSPRLRAAVSVGSAWPSVLPSSRRDMGILLMRRLRPPTKLIRDRRAAMRGHADRRPRGITAALLVLGQIAFAMAAPVASAAPTAARMPAFDHVYLIIMENAGPTTRRHKAGQMGAGNGNGRGIDDTLEAAWTELHEANESLRWFVGQPAFEERKAVPWSMYGFDPLERPKVGHRSRWRGRSDRERGNTSGRDGRVGASRRHGFCGSLVAVGHDDHIV